jgi:NAD/NADP transhydrogenase beta subunit
MCKGMNRSFFSVILGGFGGETAGPSGGAVEQRPAKQGSAGCLLRVKSGPDDLEAQLPLYPRKMG